MEHATPRIAALMTCFNRVENTLICLERLFECTSKTKCQLRVFLVDDGSSDNTSARVLETFASQPITVIQGDGSLFWAGGMRTAWSAAAKHQFDFFLWLNNDTYLYDSALSTLLESAAQTGSRAVICAAVVDSVSEQTVTYGSRLLNDDRRQVPSGRPVKCDLIEGNCVLVPIAVFKVLGSLDPIFQHAIGDHDYGLRARAHDIECYLAHSVVGICDVNPLPPVWCRPAVPLAARIRNLYSPLGYAEPLPYFVYTRRHFGLFRAIVKFIMLHVRVSFPWAWRRT